MLSICVVCTFGGTGMVLTTSVKLGNVAVAESCGGD